MLMLQMRLVDEMWNKGVPLNVTTYNAMFKGLYQKNMSEEAFKVMDRMIEEGCDSDCVTMEILTEWLSAIDELERLRCCVQGKRDVMLDVL